MEDSEWDRAVRQLSEAADRLTVLSRCLNVAPQLMTWRNTGEDVAGRDAANALDQARGDLEQLVAGDGSLLLGLVAQVLDQLPASWD